MIAHLFKYECITNLHVGSGDVNYNIVDNEVEKDPTNDYPMIYSSGVKGALREHFSRSMNATLITEIFGAPPKSREDISAGSYKFLDAGFLSRPMRLGGNTTLSSVSVVSVESIRNLLQLAGAFGITFEGLSDFYIDPSVFGDNAFLTNLPGDVMVEGEKTGKIPAEIANMLHVLQPVIGEYYAIVKNMKEYSLPVVARNQLVQGESKQLWYEEIVPHGSVFYQITLTPDENMELDICDKIIQFGGHASIGCGYTRITLIASGKI